MVFLNFHVVSKPSASLLINAKIPVRVNITRSNRTERVMFLQSGFMRPIPVGNKKISLVPCKYLRLPRSQSVQICKKVGHKSTLAGRTARVVSTQASSSSSSGVGGEEFQRALYEGLKGQDVEDLQEFLVISGHLEPQHVTGYFGTLTRAATSRWQKQQGLPPTGYWGPLSWEESAKVISQWTADGVDLNNLKSFSSTGKSSPVAGDASETGADSSAGVGIADGGGESIWESSYSSCKEVVDDPFNVSHGHSELLCSSSSTATHLPAAGEGTGGSQGMSLVPLVVTGAMLALILGVGWRLDQFESLTRRRIRIVKENLGQTEEEDLDGEDPSSPTGRGLQTDTLSATSSKSSLEAKHARLASLLSRANEGTSANTKQRSGGEPVGSISQGMLELIKRDRMQQQQQQRKDDSEDAAQEVQTETSTLGQGSKQDRKQTEDSQRNPQVFSQSSSPAPSSTSVPPAFAPIGNQNRRDKDFSKKFSRRADKYALDWGAVAAEPVTEEQDPGASTSSGPESETLGGEEEGEWDEDPSVPGEDKEGGLRLRSEKRDREAGSIKQEDTSYSEEFETSVQLPSTPQPGSDPTQANVLSDWSSTKEESEGSTFSSTNSSLEILRSESGALESLAREISEEPVQENKAAGPKRGLRMGLPVSRYLQSRQGNVSQNKEASKTQSDNQAAGSEEEGRWDDSRGREGGLRLRSEKRDGEAGSIKQEDTSHSEEVETSVHLTSTPQPDSDPTQVNRSSDSSTASVKSEGSTASFTASPLDAPQSESGASESLAREISENAKDEDASGEESEESVSRADEPSLNGGGQPVGSSAVATLVGELESMRTVLKTEQVQIGKEFGDMKGGLQSSWGSLEKKLDELSQDVARLKEMHAQMDTKDIAEGRNKPLPCVQGLKAESSQHRMTPHSETDDSDIVSHLESMESQLKKRTAAAQYQLAEVRQLAGRIQDQAESIQARLSGEKKSTEQLPGDARSGIMNAISMFRSNSKTSKGIEEPRKPSV